jgi:hypothetical protein
MAEPADNIRVPDPIEGDRLILKIFDESAFEVGIEIVLEEYVQCLNDHHAVRRLGRSQYVAGHEYLGVTSPAKLFAYIVTPVEAAVVE